jgi:hypothetical protein
MIEKAELRLDGNVHALGVRGPEFNPTAEANCFGFYLFLFLGIGNNNEISIMFYEWEQAK